MKRFFSLPFSMPVHNFSMSASGGASMEQDVEQLKALICEANSLLSEARAQFRNPNQAQALLDKGKALKGRAQTLQQELQCRYTAAEKLRFTTLLQEAIQESCD